MSKKPTYEELEQRIKTLEKSESESKQAEELILNSNATHSAMIENIGDVIAIMEGDGIIKYQSPNIEKWFGWKPEDLIGTSGWDNVHPEDIERIQEEFSKVLEKETFSKVEFRFKCKDGIYKWVELTAINRINDTAINGVLFNYHDITERKQAEKITKKAHGLLEMAEELAHVGSWEWDIEKNKFTMSDEWLQIHGVTNRNLTMDELIPIAHPDDAKTVEKNFKDALDGVRPYDLTHRIIRQDNGEERVVHAKGIVSFDIKGKPYKVLGTAQDITEKKRAEYEIQNSKNFLETIFESIPSPFYVIDVKDYSIAMANSFAKELFNNDLSKCYSLTHGYDKPCSEYGEHCPIKEVVKTGKAVVVEHHHKNKDGGNDYVQVNAYPIFDENGKVSKVIEYSIDVTERKLAEGALEESEAQLRVITDNLPILISQIDKNLKYTFANQYYYDLTLYKDEIIGKNVVDIIGEETFSRAYPQMQKALSGELISFENRHVNKNNKLIIIDTNYIPYVVNGQVESFFVLAMDITHRKLAEEALKESEERLNLIIDTSPVGICTVDILGNFVTTNPAYELMVGYSKEELVGLSFFDVTHPNDRPKNKKLFQDMFSLEATGFSMEKRYIRKDGEEISVSVHAIGIRDSEGNIGYGTAFVEDITEQKFTQLKAEEAQLYADSIIATVREPMLILDKDLQVITANRSFYMKFNVEQRNTEGRLVYELGNHQWNIPLLRKLLEEILTLKNTFEDYEVSHNFEEIGEKTMLLNARKIYRQTTGTEMILLAIEDITERRKAEDKISKQLDELRRWHTAMLDREGKVLELKKEVNVLLAQAGTPRRYTSVVSDGAQKP